MSATALSRLLTRRRIQQLAAGASWARGADYAAAGCVRSLVERAASLTATVRGTQDYAVRLEAAGEELRYSCSCPVGADGAFCKHCVATALAWLDAGREPAAPDTPLVKLDDVRPWLLEQDKAGLAGWLLEAAERDERLRERLLRRAAHAAKKGVDFAAYRRSIDRATAVRDFVPYREAGDFAGGIHEAVEPLRELLQEGHAAEVVALAEHALARVEKALNSVDDSDGWFGSILSDLQELHLQACRAARPDPVALAERLFEWETESGFGVFHDAAETYAGVLGKKGLAVYRRRTEAEWQALPSLAPGQREEYSSRRFHLTSVMEALARAAGDLEALVAVKAKDLSHAYSFLTIAELYRAAKQHDAALDWAERGMRAFPQDPDPRLAVFLADEYQRRKRPDEALALVWRLFEQRPGLENHRLLKEHADRTDTWPHWRERALAKLRAAVEGARVPPGMERWYAPRDRSELVRVFLWEKDVESAWQEAQRGGCSSALWLELAAARAREHPAEAAAVYAREAEQSIGQKNNRSYEEAVRLLQKAKQLWLRADRTAEWEAALQRVRLAHKAKRNFIALAAKL